MEILSHASAKKKRGEKKAYGFHISHFRGSFSNDIMAVNGLTVNISHTECAYAYTLSHQKGIFSGIELDNRVNVLHLD